MMTALVNPHTPLRLRVWRRLPLLYGATLLGGASLLPLSMSEATLLGYAVTCGASVVGLVVAAGLTVWAMPTVYR